MKCKRTQSSSEQRDQYCASSVAQLALITEGSNKSGPPRALESIRPPDTCPSQPVQPTSRNRNPLQVSTSRWGVNTGIVFKMERNEWAKVDETGDDGTRFLEQTG
jgi:hypothetical protein